MIDQSEVNMLSGKIVLNGVIILAKGESMAWTKEAFVERMENLDRIKTI